MVRLLVGQRTWYVITILQALHDGYLAQYSLSGHKIYCFSVKDFEMPVI